LIKQGYLVREQGRGTFVTSPAIEQDSEKLMGFTELMLKNDIDPSARIIKKDIVDPPLNLVSLMNLSKNTKLVHIIRVRYGNEQPLIIERSHFVYDLFEPIYNMDLETNSIFELLYKYTNTRLNGARQYITAINAGQSEAELLDVEIGVPLLLMKRLIKTKNKGFFQYSEDVYRSDRINFATTTRPYDQYHDHHGLPLELENENW
jgi:GntR family transcriptional regulator